MENVWKEIEIIDLINEPFRNGSDTEKAIITSIYNQINKLSKSEKRRFSIVDNYTNFAKSECLACIDICTIDNPQVSYLDNLIFIHKKHPFILINSNVDDKFLKTLGIHNSFYKKGYILPVFKSFIPIDSHNIKTKYGEKFLKLINGELNEINVADISLRKNKSIDQILERFSYLKKENEKLIIDHHITWLGVHSEKLINFLNHIFKENIETFEFDDVVKKFDLDVRELKKYLKSSMLFKKMNGITYLNRLLRRNIYSKIQSILLTKFEERLVQEDAIEATRKSTNFNEYNFYEFHKVGKIFRNHSTYSLKLISYLKQISIYQNQVETREINKIVLIDNGYENELFHLLKVLLPDNITIIRILNIFDQPIIYPFDDELIENDNVLIIIDLINTGKFILSVINLLRTKFKIDIVSIFSFIVNSSFDQTKVPSNIDFNYYIEKELQDLSEVKTTFNKLKFKKRENLSELFFWDLINKHCSVNKKFQKQSVKVQQNELTSIWNSHFSLEKVQLLEMEYETDILLFFDKVMKIHGVNEIIIVDKDQRSNYELFIRQFMSHIHINVIDELDSITSLSFKKNSSVLIIETDPMVINKLHFDVNDLFGPQNSIKNIIFASLFKRKNVISETDYLTDRNDQELKEKGVVYYCYYESSIPYYLFKRNSSLESKLEMFLQNN